MNDSILKYDWMTLKNEFNVMHCLRRGINEILDNSKIDWINNKIAIKHIEQSMLWMENQIYELTMKWNISVIVKQKSKEKPKVVVSEFGKRMKVNK